MLELESRGLGSIPTRGWVIYFFKFCNPNLHNISRSDRIGFKTKNSGVNRVATTSEMNYFFLHPNSKIGTT